MPQHLKLAAIPDAAAEARAVLRDAIAEHESRLKTVNERRARIEELQPKVWEAAAAAEQATQNIETVRQAHIDHVADPSRPAPAMTLKEAREAAAEAADHEATIRGALATAQAAAAGSSGPDYSSTRVSEAARAVLRSDPATMAALERYIAIRGQFIAAWTAVRFLVSKDGVPVEMKSIDRIDGQQFWDGKAEAWEIAFAALLSDADAPLPTF